MIRNAQPQDAKNVVHFIISAIGELTELYTGETDPNRAAAVLAQFYLQKGNRFSLEQIKVFEQAGEVAGMILCYSGQAAPALYAPVEHFRSKALKTKVSHPLEAEQDEYYIDALAVSPQYQRQGIARKLMYQAEQDAIVAGFNKIALLVDIDHTRAKQIYLHQGYQPVGQKTLHHHPYWHMVKML